MLYRSNDAGSNPFLGERHVPVMTRDQWARGFGSAEGPATCVRSKAKRAPTPRGGRHLHRHLPSTRIGKANLPQPATHAMTYWCPFNKPLGARGWPIDLLVQV